MNSFFLYRRGWIFGTLAAILLFVVVNVAISRVVGLRLDLTEDLGSVVAGVTAAAFVILLRGNCSKPGPNRGGPNVCQRRTFFIKYKKILIL